MLYVSDLIEHYIIEDPYHLGPGDARLAQYGTHVWAIISYYQLAVNLDLNRVACDFDVPLEAVEAALMYYQFHQKAIDARIILNDLSVA